MGKSVAQQPFVAYLDGMVRGPCLWIGVLAHASTQYTVCCRIVGATGESGVGVENPRTLWIVLHQALKSPLHARPTRMRVSEWFELEVSILSQRPIDPRIQ